MNTDPTSDDRWVRDDDERRGTARRRRGWALERSHGGLAVTRESWFAAVQTGYSLQAVGW